MAEEMALRTADAGDVIQTDLGPLVIPEGMGGHYVVAGSLDAAWAEAEAALPEGWRMDALRTIRSPAYRDPVWQALVTDGPYVAISGEGATPAAALRSLAEKLREPAG